MVAIVSGTALIFLRETYAPWFTAKLGFVVLLVVLMKPPLDFSGIAPGLFQPGALGARLGLQSSGDTMRPMP